MRTEVSSRLQKILLVRNDNIGDLICSIPAIQLLRERFRTAKIHLLVNSYNAPIAEPLVPQWVDQLIIYHKTKHAGFSFQQGIHLLKFYLTLRRELYDAVILLVGGFSRQAQFFARWSHAPRILGYGPNNEGPIFENGLHELEYSWNLITHFCGTKAKLPTEISYPIQAKGLRVGIQITSRKQGNRWDSKSFAQLAQKIYSIHKEKSLLIWSPGNPQTLTHPGDDAKAAEILNLASNVLEARPTTILPELISVLKECHALITPDGGAMHLAAAMGVHIVALFGQSDPVRWRPWTDRARVLKSPTRTIQDIKVDEVMKAYLSIQ